MLQMRCSLYFFILHLISNFPAGVSHVNISHWACWEASFDAKAKAIAGATVFHLHISKVAGCSLVQDLTDMLGNRSKIYSDEVCFNASVDPRTGTSYFKDQVTMVRHPRDHVLSMYQFCKQGTEPGFTAHLERRILMGMAPRRLPDTFSQWVDEWHESPRWGDYNIYEDEEMCYCPYNMQASRLSCLEHKDEVPCYPTVDMDMALANLNALTMLGVTEAYHESICLFHGHLLGSLPEHCNCQSPAWDSYHETKDTHGEKAYDGIESRPSEVLQKVDDMTQYDQVLYKAAVKRFFNDIQDMEHRFGTKILCEKQRQTLNQKAFGTS